MNAKAAINIIQKGIRNRKSISEKELLDLLDKNEIPYLLIDDIIEFLYESQIEITNVNDDSYTHPKGPSHITQRANSYKKAHEELLKSPGKDVKGQLFSDLEKPRIQATYIPLTLLAFFNEADCDGNVYIDKIIQFYKDYFELRRYRKQVVERSDSVFANTIPSDDRIKALILFNPLGRSFLVKYFSINNGLVMLNHNLWEALTASDISRIRGISQKLLIEYYENLSKGCHNDKGE